jgi:hypothetical protein
VLIAGRDDIGYDDGVGLRADLDLGDGVGEGLRVDLDLGDCVGGKTLGKRCRAKITCLSPSPA